MTAERTPRRFGATRPDAFEVQNWRAAFDRGLDTAALFRELDIHAVDLTEYVRASQPVR